jgi:antibiotic biosynthesis monooxygenase (ABM) superfamily enzyme
MAHVLAVWHSLVAVLTWLTNHPLLTTVLVTSGCNGLTWWFTKVSQPDFQNKHPGWKSFFMVLATLGVNPVPMLAAIRDTFLATRGLHPIQLELQKSKAVTMFPGERPTNPNIKGQ